MNELDNLVDKYIKDNNKEELWQLAFDYENKINLAKIADYYIQEKDSYYICELMCIVEQFLDLDIIFDNIIKTKDKEFMFYALNNGVIQAIIQKRYFDKLRNEIDKV